MTRSGFLYLALGSNLGNRTRNLGEACDRLRELVIINRVSHVYETPPWGVVDQPAFLNQVVEASSELEPAELLKAIKKIENDMGRIPSVRYGPRLIDIDILLYGDRVVDTSDLVIPHPRMFERAFVLTPLAELAPDLVPPTQTLTIQKLLEPLDSTGIVRLEKSRG